LLRVPGLLRITLRCGGSAGNRYHVPVFLLDLGGNKTRTTWADGYYVTYAYDALNRMTTATENGTFVSVR
jgi:hypothetical protein